MKMYVFFLMLIFNPLTSHAATGDWFFDPSGAVGYNPAQGTYFHLGVDTGFYLSEQMRAGVGAYYAAGEHPSDDREIGVGPFVSYVQPITSFLMLSGRQAINYVDMHIPVETVTAAGTTYSHTAETGIMSVTSAALHIFFTPNFVLSGGYRFVLGLTNSDMDDDRSGAFVGLAFGI